MRDDTKPVVTESLRVAIIGASGIGKHHAKWLQALGAQIVAIVGSSAVTAALTAQALQDQFHISVRPYHHIQEMLEREDPDLVCVCSPPALHYEHVMALAGHRCHIMCEKPLTWDDTKSAPQLLEEAREMTEAAARPGRVTAVNLQYTAAPAAYYAALGAPAERIKSFFMRMDSRRPENVYDIIWRELAPHCLSVLMAFCGPGSVDYESAELLLAEREARAQFRYICVNGEACEAEIIVGNVLQGPLQRRFGVNGLIADYEGRNDEQGVFRAFLKIGAKEHSSDDFMFLSLRQLLLAATGQAPRPLATMAEGLRNEELQLKLLARGRRI